MNDEHMFKHLSTLVGPSNSVEILMQMTACGLPCPLYCLVATFSKTTSSPWKPASLGPYCSISPPKGKENDDFWWMLRSSKSGLIDLTSIFQDFTNASLILYMNMLNAMRFPQSIMLEIFVISRFLIVFEFFHQRLKICAYCSSVLQDLWNQL